MANVSFKNISKHFGNFTAVKNLDLEVKDQEFLCLVGPSGCGKTTTLRMLAGLEEISEGEILVCEFYFRNVGNTNLIIKSIESSCGCRARSFFLDIAP